MLINDIKTDIRYNPFATGVVKQILMKISYIIIIRLISLPENFIIYNIFMQCFVNSKK